MFARAAICKGLAITSTKRKMNIIKKIAKSCKTILLISWLSKHGEPAWLLQLAGSAHSCCMSVLKNGRRESRSEWKMEGKEIKMHPDASF